ncbi:MAG: hypothetical protein H7Z38_16970 [Rubrivivax sp.]|nr:hypothetical protein [Pyrinomonadaceae bacterium]
MDDSAAKLELYLLGPFRVVAGGRVVRSEDWPRRKAMSLVKLLALQPHHHLHREQLMEALYPDLEQAAAASNLHRMVHVARRTLEPGLQAGAKSLYIHVQQGQVALAAPGGIYVDVEEFGRAAAEALKTRGVAECERALSLFAGDLLADDLYEDWAFARREQAAALYHDLLSLAAEVFELEGRRADAIECYSKLTEHNPADEEPYRQLMRLYALAGNKQHAALLYRKCEEAVGRLLGDKPERATVELFRQISAREGASATASRSGATARDATERRGAVFHQLMFRKGTIREARCTTDGSVVVCAAGFEGRPAAVYSVETTTKEWRPLGLEGTAVLAVSKRGELAVALRRRFLRGYVSTGTLARVPLRGGRAEEILDDVQWADFSPDGIGLAVVRDVDGRNRLEYPAGKVLYETGGWISHPRFSPRGDLLAFLDHPVRADDSGRVAIVTLRGKLNVFAGEWGSAQGLAWSPRGDEIWFTAAEAGVTRALWASTLGGERRFIFRGPGSLTLHDVAGDGRLLLSRDDTRLEIMGSAPGAENERELSWLDWSLARDLSDDGRLLLFTEAGEGGGESYGVYVRATDGSSAAVRLGDGSAIALSPDGEWALAVRQAPERRLVLLSTKGGAPRLFDRTSLSYQPWGGWFPDGGRIFFAANETDRATRLFTQDLKGGDPLCITPNEEGVSLNSSHALSPDSTRIAAVRHDGTLCLYPPDGSPCLPARGVEAGEVPVRWAGVNALYVYRRGESPAKVFRVNLDNGARELWKEIEPADPTGVHEILRVLITPAADAYAYTFTRNLSDLYIVEGLY